MFIKEIAASLYPWDLADEGIETIADNLVNRSNVNSIYLVGVMHFEKRPLTSLFYTHNSKRKYYLPENSRVYYRLDLNNFKNTRLKPLFSERDFLKDTDWLDVLISEARKRKLKAGVELSHTIFDTNVAYREYPDILQRNINGDIIQAPQGIVCPNHPDVREYQRIMFYDTVKNHDVDFIQTCLLTFASGGSVKAPWFFAEWMDVNRTYLGPLMGIANGGCFCDRCRDKAKELGYDWELIVRDMSKLYRVANATPYRFQEELMENNLTLGSNLTESMLLIEYPGLLQFLKFRIDSVTELFKDIYEGIKEANSSVEFRYNNHVRYPEFEGISFKDIAPYVDSVRDSDYSEQIGAPDKFVYKRNTILKIRRGISFDKNIIAAIAVRPNATPELIKESIKVLSTLGIDGLSLGHYDGSHFEHLDAVAQGMKEANITIVD
ncbi:MAG: hypothetical protein GX094_01280 [Clostridiales bacterium]|nr:hypothetical protein [Clostridiales bacterium]